MSPREGELPHDCEMYVMTDDDGAGTHASASATERPDGNSAQTEVSGGSGHDARMDAQPDVEPSRPGQVAERPDASTTTAESSPLPQSFHCPITMSVMRDPVMDYEGNTYERTAINAWLARNDTSPVTRKPLRFRHLAPNRALRDAIVDRMGESWAREVPSNKGQSETDGGDGAASNATTVGWSGPSPHGCGGPSTEFRAAIDSYLMDIGGAVGRTYRLDQSGKIAFTYESLVVVIEVPEHSASFFIYSSLVDLDGMGDDSAARCRVKDEALRKNHYPRETFCGSLSLDPATNAIFYSYSHRVPEINSTAFKTILENFIYTSIKLRSEFVRIASQPHRQPQRSMMPPAWAGHGGIDGSAI